MTYKKSFKEEAVRLSDEIGVKKAAERLGVPLESRVRIAPDAAVPTAAEAAAALADRIASRSPR